MAKRREGKLQLCKSERVRQGGSEKSRELEIAEREREKHRESEQCQAVRIEGRKLAD